MPAIRPAKISDCISLSDKLGTKVRRFVSKYCTVDSVLPAVVDELPPNKHGVCILGAKDNVLAGADELSESLSGSRRVMTAVQFKTVGVAIFRQPP